MQTENEIIQELMLAVADEKMVNNSPLAVGKFRIVPIIKRGRVVRLEVNPYNKDMPSSGEGSQELP